MADTPYHSPHFEREAQQPSGEELPDFDDPEWDAVELKSLLWLAAFVLYFVLLFAWYR